MRSFTKSDKLQNVRYDVRGPVVDEAMRMEEAGIKVLRLNIGRYFLHIAFTFLLFWILIFESMIAENMLGKVEQGKAKLRELEIICADKTFEVASMSRRSEVQKRLEAMGSKVKEPEKPAIILE